MRIHSGHLSAALLALALFGSPAFAQQLSGNNSIPYPNAANPQWNNPPSSIAEECEERQEFREELLRIRAEHEELEAEHDRLKAQCMDAKGQQRLECQSKKEALHAQEVALHERAYALHERMEHDPHSCHHDHWINGGHKPPLQPQVTSPPMMPPTSGTH